MKNLKFLLYPLLALMLTFGTTTFTFSQSNKDTTNVETPLEGDEGITTDGSPVDETPVANITKVDRVIKDEPTFLAAVFAIYSLLLYIVGLFAAKLPFLAWINDTRARVVALAILLGLGYFGVFFSFNIDIQHVIVLAVGYLFSANGLHPALEGRFNFKTIKTATEQAAKETADSTA